MRKKSYRYCRRMRTKQERTSNNQVREDGERVQWGRARRRGSYLDPWNLEKCAHTDASWKAKRNTQYYPGGKGERHEIFIKVDGWRHEGDIRWAFKNYCDDHHIPYGVEEVVTKELRTRNFIKYIPVYDDLTNKSIVHWMRIEIGEIQEYWIKKVIGVKLIWWHDKDIGLERILDR